MFWRSGEMSDIRTCWVCSTPDATIRDTSTSNMKTVISAICLVAIVVGTSKVASAQWPAYPTLRVPKTAAGQPDLNAPAPRTREGKPDLSGVWQNPRPPGAFQNASGTGGAPPPPGV